VNKPSTQIPVARIVRAHGVRGELRAILYNPSSTLLQPGVPVLVTPRTGAPRLLAIAALRPVQADLLVTLDGVEDRDAAEALRGAELSVARALLPPLDDGEYYAVDLVGCAVLDEQQRSLGQVAQVSDNGAQDLLHVVDGEREWLLPLVDAYVARVDLASRHVHVQGVQPLVELAGVREPAPEPEEPA
jgi:16S rRNA processing protein RimM